MAGHRITTDLDPDAACKLARRVARDLDFTVQRDADDDLCFTATKGNLALSMIAGAFVAYCNFRLYVEEKGEKSAIYLERNSPWWTGYIGVQRVKTRAKELAEEIADAIESEGGKVLGEKEI